MADQPTFTQADVDSLGQKLTQFKQTLSEGEIAAMAVVFQNGIPQAEDVEGYVLKLADQIAFPDPSSLVNIFSTKVGTRRSSEK
jgi:hypothetical protein